MSEEIKNVIVVGATGNLGPHVVSALLASSSFNVSILARESSAATFPPNIPVRRADFTSSASLTRAFQGQDAVVTTISSNSIGHQDLIVDAAAAAGVRRFIPSEFGFNTAHPEVAKLVPLTALKRDVIAQLREKEAVGMSWSAICVGGWFDWALEIGALSMSISPPHATIFDSGDAPYEATNLPQIARAVASTLLHPTETANQYIYIHSFTTTQNKVVAVLEKVVGKKWEVEHDTIDRIHKEGMEKLKGEKTGDGMVEVIRAGLYGLGGICVFDKGEMERWMRILELREEQLEDVIKGVWAKVQKA